jgi:hypothetical protein
MNEELEILRRRNKFYWEQILALFNQMVEEVGEEPEIEDVKKGRAVRLTVPVFTQPGLDYDTTDFWFWNDWHGTESALMMQMRARQMVKRYKDMTTQREPIKEYYPAQPNDFAKGAPEVKIPNQMDPKYRDIGARTKIVKRRASVKSTNTSGPVKHYTFRAFMTKENVQPEPPKQPLTILASYMNEAEDLTELPQDLIDDIKRLMPRTSSYG